MGLHSGQTNTDGSVTFSKAQLQAIFSGGTQASQPAPSFSNMDTFGKISSGIQMGTSIVQAGVGVASLYNAFENTKLAKEQLALQKDQYKEAKVELNHQRAVRKRLTAHFR